MAAEIRVDEGRTWHAVEGRIRCPEIVQMTTPDTPYVAMDFSAVLADGEKINTIGTIVENTSQTITLGTTSISSDGKSAIFKISGSPVAGDYVIVVPVTLEDGTTNVIRHHGLLRVTAGPS